MSEFTITFQPDGKRVKIKANQSVLDGALLTGVDLTSICGGLGNCGKCKILLQDNSQVNPLTDKERKILTAEEIEKGVRLACLTKLHGDAVVKIPEYSRTGKQRLQVEGIETQVALDPSVRKFYIELERPTIQDPKSDLDRLFEALATTYDLKDLHINFNLLKDLAPILRQAAFKVTVVIWEQEIIAIEPADTTSRIFGYAVDIGTTKLAGYLLDLTTAKVVAAGSLMNPQIPFGEDVISRVNHPEPQKLNATVIEGINHILKELKEKTGVQSHEIYEMTAVGNTIMHHLFLNIQARTLGLSPYPPVVRSSVIVNSAEVGINIHPNGKIYFLPLIAGYVGADTVGVILSTEIYKKDEICLALDIGTNTEVVLGNKDKMYACSCASGPAFEGAHIKHGMRAASGAIEKITIDPKTLELSYKTIDDEPAKGICGSAFVDLPAEMLKAGLIDVRGKFNKSIKYERIRQGEDSWELVVAPSGESETQEDITFSQKDIQQLILAKAAMQTGVLTLLRTLNIPKEKVKHLFIAGAFGSHINKESARIIGIIPEILLHNIQSVGNAAGTGARMCLVSKQAKKTAETISKQVEYIELAADANFQNTYLNSNFIPYSDLSRYPETSELLKKYGHYPEKPPHIFKLKSK
jgi:uncharacterized 2Fe-2S/4Fe-4S cluster protein (DUF4445 family)